MRVPETKVTPRMTATAVKARRSLWASRLRRLTFSTWRRPALAGLSFAEVADDSEDGVGGGRPGLVDDPPVGEIDHPVRVRRGEGVVTDHDDGLAEIVDGAAEEREELGARPRVEVARRFVGEDDLGPADQRAGGGYLLLLAPRQFARPRSEEREGLGARPRVEVARRFVGEDDLGPADQRAGGGYLLLLAPRQFARP